MSDRPPTPPRRKCQVRGCDNTPLYPDKDWSTFCREHSGAVPDDRAEGDIAAYAKWRRDPNRITADSINRSYRAAPRAEGHTLLDGYCVTCNGGCLIGFGNDTDEERCPVDGCDELPEDHHHPACNDPRHDEIESWYRQVLELAAPPAVLRGADAAEWHRYLHAEGILVEDEGEECGPWHHRVFMERAASPAPLDVERLLLLESAGHLAKHGCNAYHPEGQCRWQRARRTEKEDRP